MDDKTLNDNISKLEKGLEELKARGNYMAGQLDLLKQIKAEQETQLVVEKEETA